LQKLPHPDGEVTVAESRAIEDPSCARMMQPAISQGLDRKGTVCMDIFLHYSKSSETSGENIHLKNRTKRLKMQMLDAFMHGPTVVLGLSGFEGPELGCSQWTGEKNACWTHKFSESQMPGLFQLLLLDLA